MAGKAELVERQERLLAQYGLEGSAAKTAATSEKIYSAFVAAYESAGLIPGSPPPALPNAAVTLPMLLYSIVTKIHPDVPDAQKELLYKCVADGRVTSTPQVEAALKFLLTKNGLSMAKGKTAGNVATEPIDSGFDVDEFEKAIGVGVVITPADIERAVDEAIAPQKDQLIQNRYRFNKGPLLGKVMAALKFAEGGDVRAVIDARIRAILGPPTEEDNKKPAKKPKAKPPTPATPDPGADEGAGEPEDPFAGIPTTLVAREMSSAVNSSELVEAQKKASGGKIICRFPPEPNGYLHIGHAKAMFMDFGYAKKMGGITILRFDDTNPETERQEYIDSIIEMVEWMGHKPAKITYSSDYFSELYELAVELINRGKAYVCHLTGLQMQKDREAKRNSPWRDRPVEENLKLFDDMRKGKIAEGAAALRMKIDMQSDTPSMWDPVAYRVIFKAHPRSGDKWCVYPTYDFTHCLVDSLEWVTHSLCTLEFEARRDSYYWLLEALDLYRPFVWEFSRLALESTIVSKRKLAKIVESGFVRGWDDPRMPTLMAARRRGYPASAINAFCGTLGVKRTDNNLTEMALFEHCIRSELNETAPRAMCVLDPLKVTIENYGAEERVCRVSNHPTNSDAGSHEMPLTRVVYIERGDFRRVDEKKYFGLAPGKTAMLKYGFPITVKEVIETKENPEVIEELVVQGDFDVDFTKTAVPKGVLHWVPDEPKSVRVEVRLYSRLFESPAPNPDKFLEELNPKSETVISSALLDPSAAQCPVGSTFQFERTGYFTCDPDSTAEKLVFNQTVSLKAAPGAKKQPR